MFVKRMFVKRKLVRLEKTVSALCIILFLVSLSCSRFELTAKAGSAIIHVNPSESIQAAINNATEGDTILVSAGIYNESLQISKDISLIGQDTDQTIINGQNNQFIINITANNVTVEGFTIQSAPNLNPDSGISVSFSKGGTISNNMVMNSQQGITLASSNNNTIFDNTISNNQQGIGLSSSSNNTISNNVITANSQGGILFAFSNNNFLSGNTISNNSGQNGGIYMYASSGNVFSGNTVANNYPVGETISFYCALNTFYDNNFYDTFQISSNFINIWDYAGEGNYWSSYTGHNRGDGIGIESYTLAPGNRDNHPLMGKFSSSTATFVGETYQISVISNSTVSGFQFRVGTETGNRIILFDVAGAEGTLGFSRIAIPTELMNTSVIVLIGDKEIAPTWLNRQNTAFNYLYLTYSSRNQTILIISSKTLDLYDQLLEEFLTLNATYYVLLSNYTTQFGILSNETAQLGLLSNYAAQLNNTYNGLLSNYASLLGNYSQLQQRYQDLNASYQQHLSDDNQNLQNVRSLMYIIAAGTGVLIVATVYFSKRMYSRPKEAPEKREAILSQPANSAVYNLV